MNDSIHINIYADEIQNKKCIDSGHEWNYIGLIIEDLSFPLLDKLQNLRFKGNFDISSPYYDKNNKIAHWNQIRTADRMNISKRWLEFIINPAFSNNYIYSYILGLNNSYLNKDEFNTFDEFNSKYNRFFRSAVLFAVKSMFGNKKITIENIFHEVGQQQDNYYFTWHIFNKLQDDNISFNCNRIIFLPKDHKEEERSNIIQLCDTLLGVSTSIIHGIQSSNSSKYREELANLYYPMFNRIIENPKNKNSSFNYYNRIMISFFPKQKTELGSKERYINQFYSNRNLKYFEQISGQRSLFNGI